MKKSDLHAQLLSKIESQCDHLPLCTVPHDIVIGQGNLDAQVMVIGEAPGAEEAKQRIPFVGRSGQLFNKTLTEFSMDRADFYVSNIVKVRPPGNRDPLPEEIRAYLPFLLEEIDLISPQLFVTLGRFSMNFFLPDEKISSVHGVLKRILWEGRITYVLPIYHPAAALRSTQMLGAFRQDVGKIPKALAYINSRVEQEAKIKDIKEALF
jgi:DNA polymerase